MQDEAETDRLVRPQLHLVLVDLDLAVVVDRIGHDLLLEQHLQVDDAPFVVAEEPVRLRERLQPAGKGIHELDGIARLPEGLPRQRLQHGERVLDPVVELAQEQPLPLRGELPVGHVDIDAEEGGRLAVHVPFVHAPAPQQPAVGMGGAEQAVIFLAGSKRVA